MRRPRVPRHFACSSRDTCANRRGSRRPCAKRAIPLRSTQALADDVWPAYPGPTGASCTCATGYSGDGLSCAAVDPCATGNGGCPAACATTGPGQATCYAPASCADVAAHTTLADNATVTLYVGGAANKPWTATCHGGVEYLTPANATANFSQYTASTKSPGTNVRTTYARLRIDPATLQLDICDQTFTTSTGSLEHDPADNGNLLVTSMPLGVAMDCGGSGSHTGAAAIDVTGMPFAIGGNWTPTGNGSNGMANKSPNGRSVAITGGGDCGWMAPVIAPYNPFNSCSGGKLVQLSYMP